MTYWEQRKLAALRRMESATLNQIPEIIKAFELAKQGAARSTSWSASITTT